MFYGAVKKLQNSNREFMERGEGLLELPKIKTNKLKKRSSIFGSDAGSISPSVISEDIDMDLEELSIFGDDIAQEGSWGSVEKTEEELEFERRVKKELTEADEKAIQRKLKEQLAKEIRQIYDDATEKQKALKKRFREQINEARSILLEARVEEEKQSIDRMQMHAVQEQTQILRKRNEKKKDGTFIVAGDPVEDEKFSKEHAEELATLRKIQANLDRARARRKKNIAAVQVQNEIRRLEQAKEIHRIILELHQIGMHHLAKSLTISLESKECAEKALKDNIKVEKEAAMIMARERKDAESNRLRKERLDEKDQEKKKLQAKKKREREEKEKIKREKRIENLRQKARNREKQKNFVDSVLNTSVSRSWSYSYFPPIKAEQKPSSAKEQKDEKELKEYDSRKCLSKQSVITL